MMEAEHLCWFYRVWEEQERYIDCLVDLSISSISELNDGFWLIRDEDRLVLRRSGNIRTGTLLGKGVSWSVEL